MLEIYGDRDTMKAVSSGEDSTVRGVANTLSTNSTPISLALPIHLDSSELDPSTANEPQRMKHLNDNSAKRPTKISS